MVASASPWSQEATHELTANDYPTANRGVVEETLRYADAVFACFDVEWLDKDLPDTADCEAAWAQVQEKFEPLEADLWERDSPQYHASLPETNETVELLASLADGICGQHFLFGLALRRDENWIYFAIPHHGTTQITTEWKHGEAFFTDVSEALAPLTACLVPDGTRIEWMTEDRRYHVEGSSICISTLDGNSTACYGFTSLTGVTIEENGRRVILHWPERGDSGGFMRKIVSGLRDRLVNPPETLEFDNPETGREFARIIRETLAAYRPATNAK